jgi:hypothetical protein
MDYESAPEDYYAMVRKMPINDDGKEDLISIVKEKKTGKIVIFNEESRKRICEVTVSDRGSRNDLAMELAYILEPFKDKKIKVTFSG